MKLNSFTEENYLKSIYHLSGDRNLPVQTNAISERMHTKPASVTAMIRKLAEKEFVNYEKYQGVTLTKKGVAIAIDVVRKHRLWEVFLVEKLSFKWDEVHDIAEQLEHVNSNQLIERLDAYLAFPRKDPHGDPIPDREGNFEETNLIKLHKLVLGNTGIIVGVSEHSSAFLKHLDQVGLTLGTNISVTEIIDFDGSIELTLENKRTLISREVAKQILIKL
jgi:DtxR family Mn-dependent transcriptional regulator